MSAGHRNCNFVITGVFVLGVAFSVFSFLFQHPHLFQKPRHIELTDKYKTEFFKTFSDLFNFPKGNYFLSCGIGCKKIYVDVEGRRKYFTAAGWGNYMDFVSAQKASMPDERMLGIAQSRSAKFSESSNERINFSSEVGIEYATEDVVHMGNSVHCDGSFFGFDPNSGADFEIDGFHCH